MMWYKIIGDQVELTIYAKPNARHSEITGISARGLGVALHAQPQDGAANTELIALLSSQFGVPKSRITLRRGESSRCKIVVMPLSTKFNAFLNESLKHC